MATEVGNYDDMIDVRDVIARVEELEEEREALSASVMEAQFALDDEPATYEGDDIEGFTQNLREQLGVAQNDLDDWDGADELATLGALLAELAGYGGDEQWRGDWYPVTLIRDSYFRDYAEQLADDIGAIDANASWPCNCIDWDKAARELRMDYSSVEFDGVTYWYR